MLLSTLVFALFAPSLTLGFSFSLGSTSPSQCGSVDISWTGGTAPFNMTVIPAYDYPSVVTIPDSAYDSSSSKGSYQWTVDYPSGTQFVVMMSDSSGTGTGGISELYSVASSSNSSSCSLRSTTTDFLFYLNETSLTQCDSLEVYWDSSAVAPVSILGVIPGGQVFQLVSSSSKATSLVWNTNIASGTQVILAAFDSSSSYQGGSSSLYTVGGSSDKSCLDDSSPSSTPAVATATGTATSTGTTTKAQEGGVKTVTAVATETAMPKGAAGLSTGAIVGIVVMAVILVIALQGALLYFCCRRQIRSLLTHRREMRGQEVKPGGVVDLVETTSRRSITNDAYGSGLTTANSRYSLARTGGPEDEYDSSSVSPFWDGAAASESHPRSPLNGPPTLDLPWDLEPPRAPHMHNRHDSQSSSGGQSFADSVHNSYNYHDASPSPSLGALLPPTPSVGGFGASGARNSTFSSTSSRPNLSKAQMAAALAASNPDPTLPGVSGSGREGLEGSYQPSQDAPPGGFRRHYDAGRVAVEDLPPMYRPEWGVEGASGTSALSSPQTESEAEQGRGSERERRGA